MSALFIGLFLFPAPTQATEGRVREVPVAVSTKEGTPVEDLEAGEIEIKEGKKKRKVLSVSRDERPVDVALILDTSRFIGSEYQASLVPAVMRFWRALPAEARVTVWTCGGGVSQAVDFGVEPDAAEAILMGTAVGGPLLTLDAIVDASRRLRRSKRARRVVVAVTAPQVEVSQPLIERAYKAVPKARVSPFVILVNSSKGGLSSGSSGDYDMASVFERMAEGYGGGFDQVLTAQAVDMMLQRIAAGISSQYLVRFESGESKPSVPKVKIKRKGALARAGFAELSL